MATGTIASEADMRQFAAACAARWSTKKDSAYVVGLSGDLGAGKTTFAQALAKELGITDSITSPTFVIQKIYTLKNQKFAQLIHIDAYRLSNAHELKVLGFEALRENPTNLIIVEWPERVAELLKEDERITFVWIDEGTRTITYEAL